MSEFMHVSLRSRDRDRTSEWYCKNFGFEERRRGATAIGTQIAILVLPGNNTHIEVSDRVRRGRDFKIPEEAIQLQFTVGDMRETYERLSRNGAKITEGGPDSECIYVEDADGYEVELTRGEPGRFSALGIRVSDLDRSAKFYSENFGFHEIRRSTSPRGTNVALLELPGNNTRLALRHMPYLTTPIEIPEDLMHMAFPTEEMLGFRELMAQRGVRLEPEGERMAWVLDPDGYELEIVERTS
jgi:lactoylglutathione lyase